MEKRVDPFTRTPGIAGAAYIDTKIADEIIDNFTSDESSKYVYKITNIYKQPKTGKLAIYRDYDKTTLTLITCTNNDSRTQTIYVAELVSVE